MPGCSAVGVSILHLCRYNHEFRVFVTPVLKFVSKTFMQLELVAGTIPQVELDLSTLLVNTKVTLQGLSRKDPVMSTTLTTAYNLLFTRFIRHGQLLIHGNVQAYYTAHITTHSYNADDQFYKHVILAI